MQVQNIESASQTRSERLEPQHVSAVRISRSPINPFRHGDYRAQRFDETADALNEWALARGIYLRGRWAGRALRIETAPRHSRDWSPTTLGAVVASTGLCDVVVRRVMEAIADCDVRARTPRRRFDD